MRETTPLHVPYTCVTLFDTFPSHPLNDYNRKLPKTTFCGEREHMTTNFPFPVSKNANSFFSLGSHGRYSRGCLR